MPSGISTPIKFKYISCSYLSRVCGRLAEWKLNIQIHLMFLFIFGSKYNSHPAVFHSNTSHVLIYLTVLSSLNSMDSNSNTSHVLIYLSFNSGRIICAKIQIHLMFLFIGDVQDSLNPVTLIQIHLMFLFINYRLSETISALQIQIHLMFLFIPYLSISFFFAAQFKYISCSYLSFCAYMPVSVAIQFKYISCSYLSYRLILIKFYGF